MDEAEGLQVVGTDLDDRRRSHRQADDLDNGARLGWLIDPASGKVAIYRPGRDVETLDRPASLSGEDVLPGFALELKGIL